ncbi:MAG: DUF5687 family protein [Bacteroidales bacterium]
MTSYIPGMTSYNTPGILLQHGWLSFRRSHYFDRSMGVKVLMVFVGFIFIWYLAMAGALLPQLLGHVFPDKEPHHAFFSILLYLYAADLVTRFFVQSPPKQLIVSYLPLPVSRHSLAGFILLRGWFSIFNIYLFPLLIPLFMRTLLFPVSAGAFWLALLGSFLLGAVNHSLITWYKTWPGNQVRITALVLFIAGAGIAGGLYPSALMSLSEQLGRAFIAGNPWAFMLPLTAVIFLQTLSKKGLVQSFYEWAGSGHAKAPAGSSRIDKFFARVPVFGPYWELEWKLITRNKRTSGGIKQWPLAIIGIPLFLYFAPGENPSQYIYLLVMVAGGYGFFHLQYAFSWESRFFDLLASRDTNIYRFIQAKYYFYTLLALSQIVPMLILLGFTAPVMVLPMAGMFLYVTGAIFAFLFYTGINNSTRIDPNKRASFNFEGTSGTQFMTILAAMFSVIFLMVIAFFLPLGMENSFALVTGVSGLAFILLHPRWLRATAKKFERKKYHNLSKYREK